MPNKKLENHGFHVIFTIPATQNHQISKLNHRNILCPTIIAGSIHQNLCCDETGYDFKDLHVLVKEN